MSAKLDKNCCGRIHVFWIVVVLWMTMMMSLGVESKQDYGDALTKSILFFEGMRSGRLPTSQRMTWRKDSALHDGFQIGVDLVGGYYDAGDNVKFTFPMAFSTTMLAWSVIEFRRLFGSDLQHALDAIRWGTDYLLKATSVPGLVFAQVGDAVQDHKCWERPEDMDTPRTPFAVSKKFPGSEVSAEIAAALAAASMAFRSSDRAYSNILRKRALTVFKFADEHRGSYNDRLGRWVCPFYCDYSGYKDELIWAAAWIHRATKLPYYWEYVQSNIQNFLGGTFAEFGWDAKHAGVYVLVSKLAMINKIDPKPYLSHADKFICSVLPESPIKTVSYSPGGLMFKPGGSNMQHPTALSFLLLLYGRYVLHHKREIKCSNVAIPLSRLVRVPKSQVDYILGDNPLNMSYMVGYGTRYPKKIHHRASSLPSIDRHPERFTCQGGQNYFFSKNPNPNVLTGAVVGGPDIKDAYTDSRADFVHSEPTTYINAPLVGLLAFFKANPA